MAPFTFPSSIELKEIEQVKLPVLTQDDPIFDEFPIVEENSNRLRWEQMDNYVGLQQVRGLNGAPGKVARVGAKSYDMEPGVYGEFLQIDEKELTERRQLGTFGTPISLSDITSRLQSQLLSRRIDRIKHIIWTLLTTGTFSVPKADGAIAHTDTFPLQTYTASPAWSTTGSAVPFADLRAVVLKRRGYSVAFGRQAKLYCNQTTVNNILLNTNASDVSKIRAEYGQTINDLDKLNSIFAANDLPQIVPYDEGYLNDSGTFTNFIPTDKAVLVGKRTNGAKLGEYRMTRNAENPDLGPGPYTRVIDRGELEVPRKIEVHDGHNGGPVIYFPGAVVVLTV